MAGFLREGKKVKQVVENTSLLRSVQERLLIIEEEKERKMAELEVLKEKWVIKHLPYLGNDWMFHILLSLPVRSLIRLRCVCKSWLNMINSSAFIKAHMDRSETVLVSLKQTRHEKPNTLFVDANRDPEQFSIFQSPLYSQYWYIQILDVQQDCKNIITELNICLFCDIRGEIETEKPDCILASCNGLILVKRKKTKGGLLVMNPMTRKVLVLPPGTLSSSRGESFGFMFCQSTSEYKVVHMFRDMFRDIGCEIFSFNARSWKAVDGPPSSGLFTYKPIAAIGALHWFPDTEGCPYIVSMGIEDEKFVTIMLPKPSKLNDRLVEMGGFLCFVTHSKPNLIEIWSLRDLCGTVWKMQYSITKRNIKDLVPVLTLGNGSKMVFHNYRNGSILFTYNFESRVMEKVEAENGYLQYDSSYIPHINSLTTWTNS